MNVQKIFITLITIVICVMLGAFVINKLMPNMVDTIIDAAEGQIYRATGLSFDFNANTNSGQKTGADNKGLTGKNKDTTVTGTVTGNVDGFTKQTA